MAFLKTNTTYSELVQKICDLSISIKLGHIPIVQYLYQSGKVCTLVRITNDEDVDIMFRASAGDASAIYLYIQTCANNEKENQLIEQRYAVIVLLIFRYSFLILIEQLYISTSMQSGL